ncbi:MAG: FliM/FliN family flagellar motor switch protein [Pirellulales bacterium]|nr:FliM/FliN family flagellar motor switch protein [Pirellulales bacterium]
MDAGSFSVFSEDLEVKIALGRTQMYADELPKLRPGAVVALDKRAIDPVDVLADGRLVARGEVIVLDGKLCVRIVEVVEVELSVT